MFIDLCKLYPRSAESVMRDAVARNERLLQFRHSKRHLKPEAEVLKKFDNLLNNITNETFM
jgi:hypothetical protein